MSLGIIEQKFEEAVSSWQHENATSETPQFWELGFELRDEELLNAASRLVKSLSLKLRGAPKAESLLLLYLLSSRVSHARLSKFWPEIAEELTRITGEEINPDELAVRLRQSLDRTYPLQLGSIEHYFRYVALCFEESGAGFNRSTIVRSFFEHLVSEYPGHLDTTEREELLERAMARLASEGGWEDTSVKPLMRLMYRSGSELIQLIDSLRSKPDILEASFWDWEKLRDYWLRESGADLSRLMPEAREVFQSLIPSIGRFLSRAEVSRLVGHGGIRLLMPKSVTASDPTNPGNVCVGRMKLQGPDGASRDLQIRDNSGLTAEQIAGLEEGCWLCLNGHILIHRAQRFNIRSSAWSVEGSVPYFVGGYDSTAIPAGWFWSTPIDVNHLPEDIESGATPELDAKLNVAHSWVISGGRLLLQVDGFSVSHGNFSGLASLKVAGQVIWEEVTDGDRLAGTLKSRLFLEKIANPDFILRDEFNRQIQRNVPHPLIRGAAIFADGRSWRGRNIRVADGKKLDLLVHPDIDHPRLRGATLVNKGVVDVAGLYYKRYGIEPDNSESTRVLVDAGAERWCVQIGPLIELIPSIPEPLVYDGVRLSPIGNVSAIVWPGPIQIRIYLPDGIPSPLSDTELLVVESMGRRYPLRLKDLFLEPGHGEIAAVDLGDALRCAGYEIPFGRATVSLEGAFTRNLVVLQLFILRGLPISPPVRLGGKPELEFVENSRVLFRQQARTSAVLSEDGTIADARATIELGTLDAISVSWVPKVNDFVLYANSYAVTEAEIHLNQGLKSIAVRFLGEGVEEASVSINGAIRIPFDCAEADLMPGLRSLVASEELTSALVTVQARAASDSSPCRRWAVDLAPVVQQLDMHWVDSQGPPGLKIYHEVAALAGQVLCFRVVTPGNSVETEIAVPIEADRKIETFIPYFPTGSDTPLRLKIVYKDTEVFDGPVPHYAGLPGDGESSLDRDAVKRMIMALAGKNWSPTESNGFRLLRLYEWWCRFSPNQSWPADNLIRRIQNIEVNGVVRATSTGLRLLENFHAEREIIFDYAIPEGTDRLSVFIATLALVEQLRRRKLGTMQPERLESAKAVFVGGTRNPDCAQWCNCMIYVCHHLAERDDPDPNERRSQICKCLETPMVSLDSGLLRILEHLNKEPEA